MYLSPTLCATQITYTPCPTSKIDRTVTGLGEDAPDNLLFIIAISFVDTK